MGLLIRMLLARRSSSTRRCRPLWPTIGYGRRRPRSTKALPHHRSHHRAPDHGKHPPGVDPQLLDPDLARPCRGRATRWVQVDRDDRLAPGRQGVQRALARGAVFVFFPLFLVNAVFQTVTGDARAATGAIAMCLAPVALVFLGLTRLATRPLATCARGWSGIWTPSNEWRQPKPVRRAQGNPWLTVTLRMPRQLGRRAVMPT